ncbi:hypothetical protein LguiB_009239 [Lonicera macranthoides]
MPSSTLSKHIAAIVGVGPKLGRSIARKFAHQGYIVAILSRDLGSLSRFADEIAREEKGQVFAIRIDCSNSQSVKEAFEGVLSLGFVEVLVYNAYQPVPCHPLNFSEISVDSFEKSLAVSTVGAFHCAQQVLKGMVERGRGTILFTGCSASLTGIAGCGKFALRALSQCLAREFQPQGIHVAHVIIDGIVGAPRGSMADAQQQRQVVVGQVVVGEQRQQQEAFRGGGSGEVGMDPDAVAQTYWSLHIQDPMAWTHEIDLRPSPAPIAAAVAVATTTPMLTPFLF